MQFVLGLFSISVKHSNLTYSIFSVLSYQFSKNKCVTFSKINYDSTIKGLNPFHLNVFSRAIDHFITDGRLHFFTVCVSVCVYLYVVVVGDLSVCRGYASLHRLNPCLTQLLRLGLQHTAPRRGCKIQRCITHNNTITASTLTLLHVSNGTS